MNHIYRPVQGRISERAHTSYGRCAVGGRRVQLRICSSLSLEDTFSSGRTRNADDRRRREFIFPSIWPDHITNFSHGCFVPVAHIMMRCLAPQPPKPGTCDNDGKSSAESLVLKVDGRRRGLRRVSPFGLSADRPLAFIRGVDSLMPLFAAPWTRVSS